MSPLKLRFELGLHLPCIVELHPLVCQRRPFEGAAQLLQSLAPPRLHTHGSVLSESALLDAMRVPALVLCGREDGWAPVTQHEAVSAQIAHHARLELVEQAGHMSQMEQPRAVARAQLAWLRSPGN